MDAVDGAGPVVPGYVLRELLGRGGGGEVWLATDRVDGDDVAVKLASTTGMATPAASAVLEREIALLRRLSHPHVLPLRRVVDLPGGGRAMILEHAAGGDLGALVARRGRLEPGEVTTLVVPLARALEHIHGRGLVHGDLSPGNVLFDPTGRPMIADLGASRVLGVPGEVWGTAGFSDPSAGGPFPGGGSPDGGSPDGDSRLVTVGAGDVWSLGALAWFALTGQAPRAPIGAAVVVPLDAAGLPAGPASLTALIAACLDADPRCRPSPGEIAYRAWDAVRPTPIRLLRPDPGTPARYDRPDPPSGAGAGAGLAAGAGPGTHAGPGVGPGPDDITRRMREAASERSAPAEGAGRSRRWAARLPSVRGVVAAAAVVTVFGGGAALAAGGWRPWPPPWVSAPHTADAPPSGPEVSLPAADPGAVSAPSGAASSGAGSSGSAVPSAGDPAVASAQWKGVVERLGDARARALSGASTGLLADVDEAGSTAMTADAALVARLSAAGVRLTGLAFHVGDVRLRDRDGAQIVLETSVATSAHRQVRPDGTVAAAVPATPARSVVLRLVPTSDGRDWRVREVR